MNWRDSTLVALDFETTGLDPRLDRVLSFGAVPVARGRIRLDQAVYRVAHPGRSLPAETVRIHGIRPVDLDSAPPLAEVLPELRQVLADHPIVVWTAWVETAFLAATLGGGRRRWARRMIDVRNLAVRLDERDRSHSPARRQDLHTTAVRLGAPLEDAHDALADAFVTAELFLITASRLGDSVNALRRLGRTPPPE